MQRDSKSKGRQGADATHGSGKAVAPGKVTRSSKLPAVQREPAASGADTAATAGAVRSGWEWTMDPWMDAALRGTPVPDAARAGGDVQMRESASKAEGGEGGGESGAEATSPSPEARAAAKVASTGVDPVSAAGNIAAIVFLERMGFPVDQAKKDKAVKDVVALDQAGFTQVARALQGLGLLKEFLDTVGEDNAKTVTDQMSVEFQVPAVDFSGKGKSKVDEHYTRGNEILEDHGMKVTMASYWEVGSSWWEKLLGLDKKSLIDNDAGTFDEADIDAYGDAVDKLVNTFASPGKIVSFWFSDFIEDPGLGAGRELHGQAVREKTRAKYKGKEAVFMDINAAGHVFVHELGHIIGGKGEEAEHAGAKGDTGNVMYKHVLSGTDQTSLTQVQVNAFKTGVYAVISKVEVKASP